MKKLLLVVIAFSVYAGSMFSQAQKYKAFKVDVGALYAMPSGEGYTGGAGFYLEPKYNITDNIAVGLKMEWAIIGAEKQDGLSVSISGINTYQLTGDYYFNTNKFRPFVGLGLGVYSLGTAEFSALDGSDATVDFGSKFGFAPRAGFLLGHFRMGLEYNAITGIESGMESKNYLALKLGFEIGGGKK